MATRAIQDNLQLVGFRDPTTDVPLAGGTVEFYGGGTLVAKEAWEDKDKATAVTSVTLDSFGQAQLYFDGVYKFIVKDSLGTTKYTIDDLKYQANATTVLTKTADYQTTSDDDVILVDTTSGDITITLYTAASSSNSITIKNIGGSGNTAFVAPSGSELVDGSSTPVSLVDGAAQEYYSDLTQWFGAATTTGTSYTTDNLIAGNGIDFTAGGGQTNVSVDVTDPTIASSTTAKGVIKTATTAETVTGTATDLASTPAGVTASADAITAAVIDSEKLNLYQSTGQTITTAGALALAHGLGVEPVSVNLILQNTTAEASYSIGDRVIVDAVTSGVSLVLDATNINVRYNNIATCFTLPNKATGAVASLTNSSWQMYVNARG